MLLGDLDLSFYLLSQSLRTPLQETPDVCAIQVEEDIIGAASTHSGLEIKEFCERERVTYLFIYLHRTDCVDAYSYNISQKR